MSEDSARIMPADADPWCPAMRQFPLREGGRLWLRCTRERGHDGEHSSARLQSVSVSWTGQEET